jgi:hypothetical protein
MRLPYFVVRRSWLPVFFGKLFSHGPFQAWTFGPWIFFPTDRVEYRVLRHESRHVQQFFAGWLLGLILWLVLTPSFWWLLATPLTYTAAYVVVGIGGLFFDRSFYHQNLFERDARRYAGEPVD